MGDLIDNVNGPAQLFRRRNIKCYAVGIGRKFNRGQLLQIAAGDRRHVLTAGFRNLGSIVNTIQRRACRGTTRNQTLLSMTLIILIMVNYEMNVTKFPCC